MAAKRPPEVFNIAAMATVQTAFAANPASKSGPCGKCLVLEKTAWLLPMCFPTVNLGSKDLGRSLI
jgi:hypothetical protein